MCKEYLFGSAACPVGTPMSKSLKIIASGLFVLALIAVLYGTLQFWMTGARISESDAARGLGLVGWIMLTSIAGGIAACVLVIRRVVHWLCKRSIFLPSNSRPNSNSERTLSISAYFLAVLASPFAIFLGVTIGGTFGGGFGDRVVSRYGAAIGVGIGLWAVTVAIETIAALIGAVVGGLVVRLRASSSR